MIINNMKKIIQSILVSLVAFICVYSVANAYVVQSGDTMWKIAQNANLGLQELIGLNPQIDNPNLIYPGQEINTGSGMLGATQRPSGYKTTLAQSLTATASTTEDIKVASLATPDGHVLTTTDVGSYIILTLSPGKGNEEKVLCIGGTATSTRKWLTCTRGFNYYNQSAGTATVYIHSPGETVIISDDDAYNATVYGYLSSNNTWTGVNTSTGRWIFDVYPELSLTLTNATNTNQLISLGQANALVNQGAATSTESVAGISELATQIEMASTTDYGVNRPLTLQAKYATSSPDVRGLYIPVAKNDGYLDWRWLNQGDNLTWTGTNTFSGTTTLGTTTFSQNYPLLTGNIGMSLNITAGEVLSNGDAVYLATSSDTIRYDSASQGEVNAGQAVLTFNHTIGTDDNRFVIIAIQIDDNTALPTVTFGGSPATFVTSFNNPTAMVYYKFVNPSSGSNTISITRAQTTRKMGAWAVSFSGVDQTNSVVATTTATVTNTSLSVSRTATKNFEWYMSIACGSAGGLSADTNASTTGTIYTDGYNEQCGFFTSSVNPINRNENSSIGITATNGSLGMVLLSINPIQYSAARVLKASALSTTTTGVLVGFSYGDYDLNETAQIIYSGVVGGLSGLEVGRVYYLSDTYGEVSTTKGSNKIPVGIGLSSTELLLKYFDDRL